jgi:hypothetical protein
MKRFKSFIAENTITLDDVQFDLGNHFNDRLAQRRAEWQKNDVQYFLQKIRSKLASLDPKGEYLFYSNKLKQGVIAAWDAIKAKVKLITFLPKGRSNPKPGTEKIMIESIEYTIVEID